MLGKKFPLSLPVTSFAFASDFRLQSNVTIGPQRFRGYSSANELRVLSVFEVPIFIGVHQVPMEISKMTPGVQNHSAIKRVCLRRNHQTVVLAPCAGVRFAPVKLESFKCQRVRGNPQVRRPLVTVPALPEPVIDEKIVKDWRAKHLVLAPEPTRSRVDAFCQKRRFLRINSG